MDEVSTALNETSAPIHSSFDVTLIDSAEQDLLDQQLLGETHDVGSQTNSIAYQAAEESEHQPMLCKPGNGAEAYVALPENSHDSQMHYLALTRYRPSEHNDLDLERLTTEQGQDTLPDYNANVIQEINEENIRLRIQRDNLLTRCAALENDLSTSFLDKFDLEEQLSSAKRTIEKGRAYCTRIEADWKRDIAKLQNMTRLFEAKTENAKYVEMLRQQNVLEEANLWLSGEVQMRIEDHRFFACQRQAALDTSSYHRSCEMSSEIQMLRRWLSTVQAQLVDNGKAKTKLEGELQQERLKHQELRNAFYQKPSEPKLTLSSPPYNSQQLAYAGSSTSHKPSKFTPTYPAGFQTRFPNARASPQFSSERKSESNFGPDTFFACTASASSSQRFSTRSKSKFMFGENAVSPSTSIATDTTNGATPRTDFNFTFGGTVDHQSSLGADGNTTEAVGADQSTSAPSVGSCEMPLVEAENQQSLDECDHGEDQKIGEYMQEPSLPSGSSCLASDLPAEVGDNVDLLDGLQPKMTAEHTVGSNSTKAAGLYVNLNTDDGAQKPQTPDSYQTDSVEAEVETNSMDALAVEKNTDEKVPIVAAGADIAQKTHIGGDGVHSATAEGSVQAGKDNATMAAKQGVNPRLPPAASEGAPKPPKNKGKTSRRSYLRKVAKARKRAEVGGASGEETA